MRRDRIKLISGDEFDWTAKRWRRLLCVFDNTTGLGKKVKRAINQRARRKAREELRDESLDM